MRVLASEGGGWDSHTSAIYMEVMEAGPFTYPISQPITLSICFFFFKKNQESHICLSHFLNPVKASILMLFCYIMKIHLNTYALHPCEASGR